MITRNNNLDRIFFILCFFMVHGHIIAQQLQGKAIAPIPKKDFEEMSAIDSGILRVNYAFNAENLDDPETYIDMQRLDIGQKYSKYYSSFVYYNDSLVYEWRKKHPKASSFPRLLGIKNIMNQYWSEYKYSEYFKEFDKGILTEYMRMPHGTLKHRQSSETIPLQSWTIHNDTITVNGYVCQRATCCFRGRYYTAWFTRDIPFSNGPWKFGGLPGLILKVYDEKKIYTFECVKVENIKFPILKSNYNDYLLIDRKDLLKLQKDINENYYKTLKLRRMDGGNLPEAVSYEPLELE